MLADITALATAQVTRNIHFGRWFGEGEVGGAHANPGLFAEHLFGKIEDALFEVGKRYVLVDIQAFYLMEDAVSPVGDRLVAENSPGADDPDGRFLVLHRTDLNRTGVCAQQDVRIFRDEEGVLHVAGRMFGWKVQRREDVPVILDFGTFRHGVAQTGKDLDNLVFDQRDRVAATDRIVRSGTGHVDLGLSRRLCIFGRSLHLRDLLVDAGFERVDLLPQLFFHFGGYLFELFEQVVHLAFTAEHPDAELFDLTIDFRFECFDPTQQIVYFVNHCWCFMFLSLLLPGGFNKQRYKYFANHAHKKHNYLFSVDFERLGIGSKGRCGDEWRWG